ncbi:hypothetical protein F4803DRAFT_270775 [Xylaria telfairii]|nr:hypothetical protein F4803DRAFT_270775 [Xylaria telfairii]
MDGLCTAPLSTSVSSYQYRGPGTSFSSTTRQSIKELFSTVNSTPTAVIDPPRPAKEGYEWVWFPAGYWAEREIAELPPKESIGLFKWRSRTRKSGSDSPKHSPQTPFAAYSRPGGRMENSTDYMTGSRSQTRTPISSESSGYRLPLNRMADAPLPSPYLTEEAHVQSLQWPSLDAASRHGSLSGNSVIRSKPGVSRLSYFSSADDDVESDKTVASTAQSQEVAHTPPEIASKGLLSPKAAAGQGEKVKKSFISWRMLSEHRQRLRRSQASSEEYLGDNMAHTQPSRSQSPAKSPLRKESSVSDKSLKSPKRRSAARLFAKARWSRKISNSSRASTSQSTTSSVHNSIRSQSPAVTPGSERGETPAISNMWASEFPGGEAMRVQTPRITQNSLDQFPRSFFSDLTPPPAPPHQSLPRQRQPSLKKTMLSASVTAGGDSSASSPTPRGRAVQDHRLHDGDTRRGGGGRPTPKEKEWWEVSVPVSYNAVDQRAAFHFDMPEHLPSSPMCPANKRHKSGGTGVCVYHGRAKGAKKAAPSGEGSAGAGSPRDGHGEDSGESEDVDEAGSDVWK